MSHQPPSHLQNFIGGQFFSPASKSYIDKFNPATGRVIYQVPDSDKDDVEAAVQAGLKAFPSWSTLKSEERSKYLLRIAELIEKNFEEFAFAESLDTGKPLALARAMDITRAILNFRFFATAILHHQDTSTLMEGVAINYTCRSPIGVAGLISPWNLPLYLLSWKIAPAIAVGNTCVCKPSEFTSWTAYKLCEVFVQAGLPSGVCNIVFGGGPKAGSELVKHPKVRLISFTGGTKTGETILLNSAKFFKKVSLELGGKNPNVIFEDANMSECLDTSIRSSFLNQGEVCLCTSRLFVQDTIFDKFVEAFVERVKKYKVGDPLSSDTNMSALITKEHRDKVEYYVKLAVEEGGKILTGGKRVVVSEEHKDGYFYEPTVIVGLSPYSRTQQEEIFGPVITITPFHTEDEVVEWANSVEYGLSASVWTSNIQKANRVAQKLQSGTVWVNCWLVRDLRVPFGGVKSSGIGREGGQYSIDFFTEHKTVCMKL